MYTEHASPPAHPTDPLHALACKVHGGVVRQGGQAWAGWAHWAASLWQDHFLSTLWAISSFMVARSSWIWLSSLAVSCTPHAG